MNVSLPFPEIAAPSDLRLAEHAEVIRTLGKRAIRDIIEIGRRLTNAKAIAGHGKWLPWLEREFGWTEQSALNFMRVADLSIGKSKTILDFDFSAKALYLLAAPSTPDEVREAASRWPPGGCARGGLARTRRMNALGKITIAKAPLPATYVEAKQALAECARIDECKSWADKATALASYAKQAEDERLLSYAKRIKVRAIDRMGELGAEVLPQAASRRGVVPMTLLLLPGDNFLRPQVFLNGSKSRRCACIVSRVQTSNGRSRATIAAESWPHT